jgi:hypothetical protein
VEAQKASTKMKFIALKPGRKQSAPDNNYSEGCTTPEKPLDGTLTVN